MRISLRNTILSIAGLSVVIGFLDACQSTRSSDPEPTGPMTAYASFTITSGDSSRIPDSADWTAGKQSGKGRLGCVGFACTDTLALSDALGSDTARIRLHKLGIQIAIYLYKQTERSSNLIHIGSNSISEANLALLGSFFELRRSRIDSFAKLGTLSARNLVDYYATLVYSKTAGYTSFPDSLPVGMNADSVRTDLVRLAASSKSTWAQLAASNWGLDSGSIHSITLKLLAAGVLVPADTLALFPPPPVRVLQSVSVAKPVSRGGSPVGVNGLFSWDKGLTPIPTIEVRTRTGVDTSHFHFPTLRYLPTDTSWSLAGNLTLQADRDAIPGTDTLVVTLADGKGNKAVSKTVFEVASGDTTAPTIRFESPSQDSLVVENSTELYRLIAVASDSSGIDSVRIGNETSNGARCTTLVELALGANTFVARAWDSYGNTDSTSVTIVRPKVAHSDSTKPTIERLEPHRADTSVAWSTKSLALAWKVTDDSSVAKVSLGDSSLAAGTDGAYRKTVSLAVGANTFVLSAFDARGNVRRDTVRVEREVDTTKPAVALVSPPRDTAVDNAVTSFLVKASATDSGSGIDSVRIGSKTVRAAPYEANLDLSAGANPVSIQAWDKAGNASQTISVKIVRAAMGDTTKPTIARKSPRTADTTVEWGTKTMTFQWSVSDDSTVAKVVFDDSTLSGTDGLYQITIGLAVGAKTHTLVAIDGRGNTRKDSVRVVRQADTSKPVVARGSATRDTVLLSTATSLPVSWTVSDNALKSVAIEGTATTGTAGVFSRTVALTETDSYIHLVALDSSGNQTVDSVRVRRLGPPTIAPPGGVMEAGSLSASLTASLAVDSMQYSFDKATWSKWKGAALPIASSKILYVRSKLGNLTSAVDSEVYLFPPSLSLATGAYTGTQALTITAPGAAIEVSTDNGTVWATYATPLSVSTCNVVQARSKLGGLVSAPVTAVLAFPPVLSPGSKDDTLDTLRVTATATGADSLQLSTDSLTWTKANSHLVAASGKLYARAWIQGVVSSVAVGNYTFRCAAPRFWPTGGSFGSTQYIVLSTPTSGASLQYSYDGGSTWKTYVAGTPVPVKDANTTLSARTVKSGSSSTTATTVYKIADINWDGAPSSSYDTLRDKRTGQTYKKIKIGTQTWMAENLNFAVDSSTCENGNADSCAKYGRYYQWTAAMALDPKFNTTFSGVSLPRKGLCPDDWHLPAKSEIGTLVTASISQEKLKSSSGWKDNLDSPADSYGNNESGFNLLPAGFIILDEKVSTKGAWAILWTASEFSQASDLPNMASYANWTNGIGDGPQDDESTKSYRYPVRCLAD
jgi:uncharacterized protein (TIGR02145 family)